jgi:hypothetical protein
LLRRLLECRQRFVPESIQPIAQRFDAVRIDPVKAARAVMTGFETLDSHFSKEQAHLNLVVELPLVDRIVAN